MNATTKKTGSGKRAVYAIEEAIADTRSRIAASAGEDLKQKAQAALSSGPRLKTEKDGRMFAFAVLDRLENANADEATAYPYSVSYTEGEEIKPWREGPQWDGFYRDLSHLLNATEDARKGFASIFTEKVAEGALAVDTSYLRKLEREGKFLPFGTPGTAYQVPKPTKPTKAERAKSAVALAEAKGPFLPKGEAAAIEAYLIDSAVPRRAALAFLEKPYAEMVEAIKSDDKVADACAELAIDLEGMKQHYLSIAFHLSRAAGEVKRAVFERIEAREKQRARKAKAK